MEYLVHAQTVYTRSFFQLHKKRPGNEASIKKAGKYYVNGEDLLQLIGVLCRYTRTI